MVREIVRNGVVAAIGRESDGGTLHLVALWQRLRHGYMRYSVHVRGIVDDPAHVESIPRIGVREGNFQSQGRVASGTKIQN